MGLSRPELQEAYTAQTVAIHERVPDGAYQGYVLPGTGREKLDNSLNNFLTLFWRGKVFYNSNETTAYLVNNTLIGEKFRAYVYRGPSNIDQERSIIIDYSFGSTWENGPLRHIRDEIRPLAPNVYLGAAFWDGRKHDYNLVYFALERK